jgi:hypothetical protein
MMHHKKLTVAANDTSNLKIAPTIIRIKVIFKKLKIAIKRLAP